jgi:hypothetical protein
MLGLEKPHEKAYQPGKQNTCSDESERSTLTI